VTFAPLGHRDHPNRESVTRVESRSDVDMQSTRDLCSCWFIRSWHSISTSQQLSASCDGPILVRGPIARTTFLAIGGTCSVNGTLKAKSSVPTKIWTDAEPTSSVMAIRFLPPRLPEFRENISDCRCLQQRRKIARFCRSFRFLIMELQSTYRQRTPTKVGGMPLVAGNERNGHGARGAARRPGPRRMLRNDCNCVIGITPKNRVSPSLGGSATARCHWHQHTRLPPTAYELGRAPWNFRPYDRFFAPVFLP